MGQRAFISFCAVCLIGGIASAKPVLTTTDLTEVDLGFSVFSDEIYEVEHYEDGLLIDCAGCPGVPGLEIFTLPVPREAALRRDFTPGGLAALEAACLEGPFSLCKVERFDFAGAPGLKETRRRAPEDPKLPESAEIVAIWQVENTEVVLQAVGDDFASAMVFFHIAMADLVPQLISSE
ncbi:MAG: hypothetical protein AAGF74_02695 [Pseudomonadota bacterium]